MTTSPAPEDNGSTAAQVVPEESAKAVGFELVKHYYTALSTKPETIYGMYGKNASLQHHNPFAGDFTKIDTAFSRDSIKEHYKSTSVFENCKIQIHNLDAQPSLDESVMVLCNGEIAFNDEAKVGPSYKFVQSFFITPKKSGNVTYYDIINDILRFIPDVDAVDATVPAEVEEEAPKETVAEEQEPAAPAVTAEESRDESTEEPVTADTSVDEEPTKENLAPAEAPKESTPEAKPSKPLSWAARIAPKAGSAVGSNASAKSPPKDLKDKSKKKPVAGSKKPKREDSPTATAATSPTANGKVKRKFLNKRNEEVFPIYIKGLHTDKDTEESLVDVLQRNFGKVDGCKLNNHVAMVDFVKQSAQDKALKAGTVKLNDHDIKLEPRVEKKKENKK